DRECRARVLFRLQSARTCALGEFANFGCDLTQRLLIRGTNNGCDQSVFDCDSDSDVSAFVVAYELLLKRSVDFRVLNQRRCGDLNDHVVDTDLQIRIERVDAAAHFRGAVHLDFSGKEEVWYWSE